MEELKKEEEQAFHLASSLRVSGDGVDVVAGIREHLRRAYALAKEKSEGQKDG